jgi:hypothetical protein
MLPAAAGGPGRAGFAAERGLSRSSRREAVRALAPISILDALASGAAEMGRPLTHKPFPAGLPGCGSPENFNCPDDWAAIRIASLITPLSVR